MNLSPEWVPLLLREGWETRHWRDIGAGDAADIQIMEWARHEGCAVLTQDLDFTRLLFDARAALPSVILLRVGNELDEIVQRQVCATLHRFQSDLEAGALLSFSLRRAR